MKRAILFPAIVAGMLGVGTVAGAADSDISIGCSGLQRTQTYEGWGPAAFYGQTVTVAFTAADCTASLEDGVFSYDLAGAAVAYAGEEATGPVLDSHDFVSAGRFSDPDGDGWPPRWWACDVAEASISWEIPGVYSFEVSANDGTWALDVQVPGAKNIHWQHDGCS